jgi:hypothetical protein
LPVSAWASKWIRAISPAPWTLVTPVAFGIGDGVVAPEDDRHLSCGGYRLDHVGDAFDRLLDVSGGDVDVADVDHAEHSERVDPGGQVGAVSVHRPVVGLADRLRSEPRARAVGGPPVEGRAEDHHLARVVGEFVEATPEPRGTTGGWRS